ncbi:APH(6) family putative aminoglycoside O-phosphotransferase [Diaminobutyricibacter tongyongensis]|uniref:APH(6) family putative aminoglycoside O-phosphotransferase n=1 Tax=Leifsonia tongyongensis TaxID=1268043 RepID=A0A6L9Y372_9MICO|nr:aminoglycoside phosphotransferase family protein [Diaminobutyricibacter tongyongensis]NEN07955.1 APH(6) family putative aminoglycoside O-phosphotransferase [Diaminobutyricibacter tongyongensis]
MHVQHDAPTGADALLAPYLRRWELISDGPSFTTATSVLLPVISRGRAAILKVATEREEELGGHLMVWWNGRGSARVYEHDGPAIVLERAQGTRSLTTMAAAGMALDDTATRVLCTVASTLHAVGGEPPDGLVGLDRWFQELFVHAETRGGFFAGAASVARDLIGDQREQVVLHGDVHHGNVLDFGADGWAAIDPKHVTGDRAFDFANIFCNPDARIALAPGRLERQLAIVCEQTGIERERMTAWIVAWCGLSAAWGERSDGDAGHALEVGLIAERMLGRSSG